MFIITQLAKKSHIFMAADSSMPYSKARINDPYPEPLHSTHLHTLFLKDPFRYYLHMYLYIS
jgi:hypothetical protein